jgi:predicted metalloprotease with PDZ domain
MSQRTNWVDARFAVINGAPTFMTLADSSSRPHEVALELPPSWRGSMSALPVLAGVPHRYVAADFDTLVDSPIVAGNPSVHEFVVDGKPHYLVNEGDIEGFDGARAARDFETIVREQQRFWGTLPYDRYVALNVIGEDSGALEHRNSTLLMTARGATRTRAAYLRFLTVLSHEFFHAWNGKRLRPLELGPFDYEKEAPTRSLWIVEGFSDYYGDLIVQRAGLMSRDEFLAGLSASIEELQTTPGRLVQSVELASFDAWIKYYRPDENSPNSSVSYYTKGAVLAFLLDARIRRLTNGARSLDDVLRAAYTRYSGARGFTPDQFREVAEQVAGTALNTFWDPYVRGTGELDYSEALATFGLRFGALATTGRAWLGVVTRSEQSRLVVSETNPAGPATAAAFNVDDEILAIDEVPVRAGGLTRRLEQYEPGSRVTVLVARGRQLLRLEVTLANEPVRSNWRLAPDPAAPAAVQLNRWLPPPP